MVRQPRTRYAKGPEGNIAFQVVGDGPMDLVIVPGWLSHVDMLWNDPGWVTFVGELASFARVILYDKRGTGLSDPIDGVPILESRADDLLSVLDAAGCDRTALFGFSEGGRSACCWPPPTRNESARSSCMGRSPAGCLTTMVHLAGRNGLHTWLGSGRRLTTGARDGPPIGPPRV
jgi:hypothetical protein